MLSHILVERYLAGDCEAVWDDIRGDEDSGSIPASDVRDVAIATCNRIRQNADTMVLHLLESGYDFRYAPGTSRVISAGQPVRVGDARRQPRPAFPDYVVARMQAGAFVPILLEEALRRIGDISLRGSFEGVDLGFLDPFEWLGNVLAESGPLFSLSPGEVEVGFAPDYLQKTDRSGGEWTVFVDPAHPSDPFVGGFDAEPGMRLLDYFRYFIDGGGFPLLEPDDELWTTLRMDDLRARLIVF
jgi:hypothetical protein